jgi:hypothetical protein
MYLGLREAREERIMEEREDRLLRQKRVLLLRRMAGVMDFVRGSVVLMKRRCGRSGCRRCASGETHPTWVFTVSHRGKTQTVYLGDKRVAQARRMAANYRRLTEWMEEVSRVNLLLLTRSKRQERPGERDGPQGRGA